MDTTVGSPLLSNSFIIRLIILQEQVYIASKTIRNLPANISKSYPHLSPLTLFRTAKGSKEAILIQVPMLYIICEVYEISDIFEGA